MLPSPATSPVPSRSRFPRTRSPACPFPGRSWALHGTDGTPRCPALPLRGTRASLPFWEDDDPETHHNRQLPTARGQPRSQALLPTSPQRRLSLRPALRGKEDPPGRTSGSGAEGEARHRARRGGRCGNGGASARPDRRMAQAHSLPKTPELPRARAGGRRGVPPNPPQPRDGLLCAARPGLPCPGETSLTGQTPRRRPPHRAAERLTQPSNEEEEDSAVSMLRQRWRGTEGKDPASPLRLTSPMPRNKHWGRGKREQQNHNHAEHLLRSPTSFTRVSVRMRDTRRGLPEQQLPAGPRASPAPAPPAAPCPAGAAGEGSCEARARPRPVGLTCSWRQL